MGAYCKPVSLPFHCHWRIFGGWNISNINQKFSINFVKKCVVSLKIGELQISVLIRGNLSTHNYCSNNITASLQVIRTDLYSIVG